MLIALSTRGCVHSTPGQRILNDHLDGSMWMYDLEGLNPVFAPRSELWLGPSWVDRNYLQAHIAEIATDERTRLLAEEWRIRYVVVGDRVPPGVTRRIDPTALAKSSGLRMVWRQDGAMVFEMITFRDDPPPGPTPPPAFRGTEQSAPATVG